MAVGIAQTSLQGEWLLLNQPFCEILGYTQAELRGKTFLDVTHPDDREAVLDRRLPKTRWWKKRCGKANCCTSKYAITSNYRRSLEAE